MKIYGMLLLLPKKGKWHHSAAFVLTNATSVVRWAIYKQFVQKIRIHREGNRNLKTTGPEEL